MSSPDVLAARDPAMPPSIAPRFISRARTWGLVVTVVPTLVGSVAGVQSVQRLGESAEFAIDQWTTKHGLPQNFVNAILQMPGILEVTLPPSAPSAAR